LSSQTILPIQKPNKIQHVSFTVTNEYKIRYQPKSLSLQQARSVV